MRRAIDGATDLAGAARAILELAAKWSPDILGRLLGDALELAALSGREAVFADGEQQEQEAGSASARQGSKKETSFADPDVIDQPFKERIDYLEQKRGKPTKTWRDAMRGMHDRGFVIAGATDMAMLSDFQTAIVKARTLAEFRKEFDRIVAQYGWAYKGERGWRTRVIFETNLRSSHMAGRLKQMRDPDVLKLRPFWQYRHGELRRPRSPRPQHEAWHGLVLAHDDPFWQVHYPPNGWFCSCGVRNLSYRDLKRLGKDGPDPSPQPLYEPVIDPVSGRLIEQPQGVAPGWDYMPGDLWERGLVPSALIDEGGGLSLVDPRHPVLIDEPEPWDTLMKSARSFKTKPLAEGLEPEDYVRAFLKPFGADIGKAVLFEDKAGLKVPVSDQLFRDRRGNWKVMKGARATITPLLAEALMDPDEIWIGVARKKDPVDRNIEELVVDRRYIRVHPEHGLMIVYEIGERYWEAITAYNTITKSGKPDLKALDRRRGGKLVYKRPKK